MKKKSLMFVMPACLLLSGCQLDSYEIPSEELYAREFVKKFGAFDKDHDWNMAAGASVTVNPGTAGRVKVYANVGGRRYIFADYEDVQGTQTIGFDLPKNVAEVIVKVGNVERAVKVGGTVDFSDVKSRSIMPVDQDGIKVSQSEYITLPHADVLSYRETLPEKTNNVGKVIENFNFKANGSFTIYPVYWNTRHVNTLGIYTKNADGTVNKYPIFKNDGVSDDLQYRTYTSGQVSNWTVIHRSTLQTQGYTEDKAFADYTDQDWEDFKTWFVENFKDQQWLWMFGIGSFDGVAEIKIEGQWTDEEWNSAQQHWGGEVKTECILIKVKRADTPDGSYQSAKGNESADAYTKYYDWKIKGITIDITEGVEFGMYIDNTDDNECFYSEASLNTDPYQDKDGNTHLEGEKDQNGNMTYDKTACHAATYMYTSTEGNEYRVLAFEDWTNAHSGSDMDFNDMVFFITSAYPSKIPDVNPDPDLEDVPYTWILAAEDLGNLDDFDFNDVVVSVEHVAGQTSARITALAAGGTLPVYLMYDGMQVDAEFHAWFGDGNYSTTQMINTGSGYDAVGKSVTINVPADFRMSHDTSKVEGGNMGGFSLKVQRADGTFNEVKAPEGSDGKIAAPQMICLPAGWKWPKERTGIHMAYPRFNEWCGNHDCNNWHDSCVESCVYRR